MMKMRRLGCLLYRELYLSRKSLIVNGVMAVFVILLGIVVPLSVKYGNLALIPEEEMELLEDIIYMFSTFMPVYACLTLGMSVVESWQFECERKWRLFRKTTPIRGSEYVFAKYLLLFIATVLAIPLAALYIWCHGLIMGTGWNGQGMQLTLTMVLAFLSFVQVWQVLILLFGSIDRAAIVMCLLFVVFMFGGMEIVERSGIMIPIIIGEATVFKTMLESFTSLLPQMFVVFAAVTLVSFFLTVRLYERREK